MSEAIDKSAYGSSKISQWGVADRQLTNAEMWISFFVMFVFGIICVYQYMMVTSILPQIVESFGTDVSNGGMMMSVFSIIGIIIAYPCTFAMHKIGVKITLVATGVLSVLGTLICIYAGDFSILLVGRTLQGCGFCLMSVIGPNVVPRLFPSNRVGTGMGIFAVWFPIGLMIANLSVPQLFAVGGWTIPFWTSAVAQIILVILIITLFKLPLVPESMLAMEGHGEARKISKGKLYFGAALVVGFTFIGFEIAYYSYNDFYPTFLQGQGLSIAAAALPATVGALLNIPCGIAAGVIVDKFKCAKILTIASFLVIAACFITITWMGEYNAALMWVSAILLAVIPWSVIPVTLRVLIPSLCPDTKKCDWALTGMTVGTTLGGFGAGFFPAIVAAMGTYHMAACVIAIVPIAMAVVFFFIPSDRKLWAERNAE